MKFNPANQHWHEPKRRCPSCGILKLLRQFYKHKGRPNGHAYECKLCSDARTAAARSFILLPKKNKKIKRWFNESDLVRSYLSMFKSNAEAAEKSGVGVTTIYAILAGRRVKESTEEKIIAAAVRAA